jgi:hypothetical protein
MDLGKILKEGKMMQCNKKRSWILTYKNQNVIQTRC